jgi:ElaB/YqjD/DUF883 family membrane-anchored ribosome-binding protein
MATRDRGEFPQGEGPKTDLTRRSSSELTRFEESPTRAPEKHYNEETAEIRASINEARRQISQSLDEIQYSVQESLDWRGWVDEHPWETVGIGVAVGFYLGLR